MADRLSGGVSSGVPDPSEERWPDYRCQRCGQDIFGNPRMCPRCGYTVYDPVGVRKRSAEQTPSRPPAGPHVVPLEETVEAVARELHRRFSLLVDENDRPFDWAQITEEERQGWCEDAREVLRAGAGVPTTPEPTAFEDFIAEVAGPVGRLRLGSVSSTPARDLDLLYEAIKKARASVAGVSGGTTDG